MHLLIQLAELQDQNGQSADARSSVRRAFPGLEALTEAEPENLRWRQGLARPWESLAREQSKASETALAGASAEKALAIAGELARTDPAYAYDLACARAIHGRLSSSKADADEAVAARLRAIKDGFDNGYLLRADPRLDGLRSRPDFPASTGKSG